MIRFDDAPSVLVGECERFPGFACVQTACLVRDLRGRVRLVVKARPGQRVAVDELRERLTRVLGAFFAPPVLCTDGPADEARLAGKILELAEPWEPSFTEPATGETHAAPSGRWRKLERRLSKHSWLLEAKSGPPWKLAEGKPAIVTFYSFKGGVGRSTALAACAWQLARNGKTVAVVDLDLEAPGVASLFEATSDRGVLDFLVEFRATGGRALDGIPVHPDVLGEDAERITILPAGNLDLAYLEKLARLDFHEDEPWKQGARTPLQLALEAMLHSLARLGPDYILIDSRAGLHDIAGLSLHGLAHVDVLFGRASAQSFAGMDLAVQALFRRRAADVACVVVHAFAPAARGTPAEQEERQRFRARLHETFERHVYAPLYKDMEIPGEDATDAPHSPFVVHADDALRTFGSLADVETFLFGPDYKALCERIVELCKTDEAP